MLDKLGGRKFIFAMLVTVLSFILVCLKMVEPVQWFTFIDVIGGIYVIGNVASGVVDGFSGKPGDPAPTEPGVTGQM